MITIRSKMEDKKSSRLMETVDIMDLNPFVGNVLYITQDRAIVRCQNWDKVGHQTRNCSKSGSEEILLAVIKRCDLENK
ncbi:hypothetical protein Tco_0698166 [Tanacetum coccineum]